jgi:hypothetical protein
MHKSVMLFLVLGFPSKSLKPRGHLEDLIIDDRIINNEVNSSKESKSLVVKHQN